MSNVIRRKIMFYHIHTEPNLWNPRAQIDFPVFLKGIQSLSFPEDKITGRYWVAQDANTYCCWVDKLSVDYCSVQFGKLRHNSTLPQMEHKGILSPLSSSMPNAASIAELMHVVFFPDNIIGAEHNYYGPRIPHLMKYLEARAADPLSLFADALLKHDAAEQLQAKEKITLLRLKIPGTYTEIEENADNEVIKGLKTMRNLSDCDMIEIVLQKRNKPLAQKFTRDLAKLIRRDDFLREADKLEIKGLGEEAIDQLQRSVRKAKVW